MTTNSPPAPTTDARWNNERIRAWRYDAETVTRSCTPEVIESLTTHLVGQLRGFGIATVTEDLLLILWASLGFSADFIQAGIVEECHNPMCGSAALQHAAHGLGFEGVAILQLEPRIGQPL